MTARRRLPTVLALTLGVLLLAAAPAHANMPTTLLFPEAFHLLAGNARLRLVHKTGPTDATSHLPTQNSVCPS